jgi:asparagine synthetase B (glutamine-hydrolysing)
MVFDDALKAFKPISRDVLERLIEDDIIAEPFTANDRNFLTALSRLWKDEWYVAQMNKSFTPDKRAIMLAFPDFGKIERYILSSYLNLKPGMKLSVKEMTRRIREHFKLDYPASKIRRVRQIAYNLRRQERGKTKKRFVIQMALLREGGDENVCQKI